MFLWRRRCQGKLKRSGGFIWKYTDPGIIETVNQYTLDGKLVKTFDSLKDAVDNTGFYKNGISLCCIGKRRTSNGFIWKREVKN